MQFYLLSLFALTVRFELSAGGEDVATSGGADGGRVARIIQDFRELMHAIIGRAFKRSAGPRIKRY